MFKRSKGFTLFELVIVLAIIGIIGTAAYNAFKGHTTYSDCR